MRASFSAHRRAVYVFILLTFSAKSILAQPTAQRMSAPLALSTNSWNRVVQLADGNTFLLHLRSRQPLVVKVFDSTGAEQASAEYIPKQLNVRVLNRSAFRGLFAQSGEVLLFLEQEVGLKNTLFRLRFSGATGKLLSEEAVGVGEELRVVQRQGIPRYAVLSFTGAPRNGSQRYGRCSSLTRYGADGIAAPTVPFHFADVAGEGLRPGALLNVEMDRAGGVLVTVGAGRFTTAQEGKQTIVVDYLLNARLRASDTAFTCSAAKIPSWISPVYTLSTNISSPTAVYQYLVASVRTLVQDGLLRSGVTSYEGLFLKLDGTTLQPVHHRSFLNPNELVRADSGTNPGTFSGFPLGMWTDGEGTSTMLTEELGWAFGRERGQYYQTTNLSSLHLTQLNPRGAQIFDTVLPKMQHLDNYLYASEVMSRPCSKYLFRDVPGQQSDNQLMSAVWWKATPALYAIFNDAPANFTRADATRLTPVRNPYLADPVVYRFLPSREVSRWWLFGEPAPGETRACLLESAHFDAARKRVATLIIHSDKGKQTVRMAWCSLP